MKNIKGVTLITLAITVIVLIILSSVAIYSGVEMLELSELTDFTAELRIMQSQVNSIYDESKDEGSNMGDPIIGEYRVQADRVFKAMESGITSYDGYRYWSKEYIKSLNIEGVEQDFFVNIEKRSVVSYSGFEYQGETYYTVEQLPDKLYNVEYNNPNTGKPTFDLSVAKEDSKWRVTISNIQYSGYIDKWQVKYKTNTYDYWNTSDDLSFEVEETGNYVFKIVNGDVESEENQYEIK